MSAFGEPLQSTSTSTDLSLSRGASAWLFGLLSAAFLTSVFYHAPDGNYFTICGFKNLTGLPCPGCGLAHSFCALAKGHILSAFEYNALGPVLFIISVALWMRAAFTLFQREDIALQFARVMDRLRLGKVLMAGFILFGAARIIYLLVSHPAILNEGYLARSLSVLHH